MPKRVNRKFALRVASLLVVITLAVAASASGQQSTPVAAVSQAKAATLAAAPPFAGTLDAIPEPASVALLMLGAFLVVGRRQQSVV